jgi:hypothetical protein
MTDTFDCPLAATSQVAPQGLPMLVTAMIKEVDVTGTQMQSRAFFTAVGRRIAGYCDVSEATGIRRLADQINQFWATLGWGHARLEMVVDAILIHHTGMPQALAGDVAGHWPCITSSVLEGAPYVSASLLEGAYDTWLRTLGSGPALHTTLVSKHNGLIVLRHGV